MSQQTLEPPAAAPQRRRGAAFWVGVSLMLAGVVLLGYVAWQFWGTNFVAHQKQEKIIDQTERVWSGKAGASGTARGTEL